MKKPLLRVALLIAVACSSAHAEFVRYVSEDKPYKGYYLKGAAPDAPLVLLFHGRDGLTAYEIKRAEMLQALGYTVFCADLFGEGARPNELADRELYTDQLHVDRPKMRRVMQAALKTAEEKGANIQNAVALGYCFGGTAVLELARSGADLKGFCTFYGGLELPRGQDYTQTKGQLLILHGTGDKYVKIEQLASLGYALETANVPHELISYGGAPHGWTIFDSSTYRKAQDLASWDRFLHFLEQTTQ